jgi:hypothetical protein
MANSLPEWLPERLRKALSKPTMTIPEAGECLRIESRSGSYNAAAKGKIPWLDMGGRKPVPTAWVRR